VPNPKRSQKCELCGHSFRSRKRRPVCPDCDRGTEVDSSYTKVDILPPASNLAATVQASGPRPLDVRCMRERWYHELIYQQVDANGLEALGIEKLRFLHEDQRSLDRLGEWTHKDGTYRNRYDLLLKGERRHVCIEIKLCADEMALAQVQRYYVSLRKLSIERGLDGPFVALVCVEMTDVFREILEQFNPQIAVYRITFLEGSAQLERVW